MRLTCGQQCAALTAQSARDLNHTRTLGKDGPKRRLKWKAAVLFRGRHQETPDSGYGTIQKLESDFGDRRCGIHREQFDPAPSVEHGSEGNQPRQAYLCGELAVGPRPRIGSALPFCAG